MFFAKKKTVDEQMADSRRDLKRNQRDLDRERRYVPQSCTGVLFSCLLLRWASLLASCGSFLSVVRLRSWECLSFSSVVCGLCLASQFLSVESLSLRYLRCHPQFVFVALWCAKSSSSHLSGLAHDMICLNHHHHTDNWNERRQSSPRRSRQRRDAATSERRRCTRRNWCVCAISRRSSS
jgi:hypothetical protein